MHCHVLSLIVTMSVVPHWCRQHVAYILRESRALLHLSAQQCSGQSQSQALLQQGAGSRRVSAALWCQDPSAFCLPVLCWQETPETSHDNAMIVSTSFHIYISLSRPAFAHTSSSSSIIFHSVPFAVVGDNCASDQQPSHPTMNCPDLIKARNGFFSAAQRTWSGDVFLNRVATRYLFVRWRCGH